MKLIENGLLNLEALSHLKPEEYASLPFVITAHFISTQYDNTYSAIWWLINEISG